MHAGHIRSIRHRAFEPALRHNHGVTPSTLRQPSQPRAFRRIVGSLLLVCLSSACDRHAPEPTSSATMPFAQLEHDGGSIQWQGLLACADCGGIDTALSLQRSGAGRDYALTETYLTVDGNARFVETGHWQLDQGLVRLQGSDGGRRVFALLPDGRLQPRDGRGRPFPPREGDFLVPVSARRRP